MKKEPKISSLIDKAIFDYKILEPGDKILIGASGGKDSTALIKYFSDRVKRPDCGFAYKAINIQSDFSNPFPQKILELFKEWQVPFESIDVNILERVKEGHKMNCYWCSTQRRSQLLTYAIENGYNKIALGHHLDDLLETLLMNMLNKGELSTMIPLLKYKKYPVTIIRPMIYIPEELIIKEAKSQGYYGYTCTCDYQENSERKKSKKLLQDLTGGEWLKKERLFASLKNIQPDYLP
ncbi:MAG: tRNA 2-thiocytidine biosynthesis TtcA family protein [Treponema sp.]|nr:tRNA 2-thiocytidine biosynthesis TtcA family protein [Treponema sp.]